MSVSTPARRPFGRLRSLGSLLPLDRLLPLGLLLAVGAMLGVTAVIAKAAASNGWPPLALLCWAVLGAALVQAAMARARGIRLRANAQRLRYYFFSGILFAAPNALAFGAAQHVGASIVALCFAFPLILTYGLALLFRLERPRTVRIAGVLAGLAGAMVIALGDPAGGSWQSPWLLAALAAPLIIAGGNIYRTLHWPEGATALELSPGMLFTGGLVLLIGLAAAGAPMLPAQWSITATLFVIGLTAIYALLYGLYFVLQKLAGPVYLSQIGSVSALVGVTLAILLLDEVAAPKLLAAGALIGLGILLVNGGKRKEA